MKHDFVSTYTNSTTSTCYEQSLPLTLNSSKNAKHISKGGTKGSPVAQAGRELYSAEGDRELLALMSANSQVLGLGACTTSFCITGVITSCLLGKYSSTQLHLPPATKGKKLTHRKIVLIEVVYLQMSKTIS